MHKTMAPHWVPLHVIIVILLYNTRSKTLKLLQYLFINFFFFSDVAVVVFRRDNLFPEADRGGKNGSIDRKETTKIGRIILCTQTHCTTTRTVRTINVFRYYYAAAPARDDILQISQYGCCAVVTTSVYNHYNIISYCVWYFMSLKSFKISIGQ